MQAVAVVVAEFAAHRFEDQRVGENAVFVVGWHEAVDFEEGANVDAAQIERLVIPIAEAVGTVDLDDCVVNASVNILAIDIGHFVRAARTRIVVEDDEDSWAIAKVLLPSQFGQVAEHGFVCVRFVKEWRQVCARIQVAKLFARVHERVVERLLVEVRLVVDVDGDVNRLRAPLLGVAAIGGFGVPSTRLHRGKKTKDEKGKNEQITHEAPPWRIVTENEAFVNFLGLC